MMPEMNDDKTIKEDEQKKKSFKDIFMNNRALSFLVLCVVGIVVLLFVRNKSNINKYNTIIDEYNGYAESINFLIDNYSDEMTDIPEKIVLKNHYSSTESISEEVIANLSSETLEENNTLIEYETSIYNAIVDSINDETKNYKYMISRLDSYGIDTSNYETINEIDKIDSNVLVSKFASLEEYKNALSDLEGVQETLNENYYAICLQSYNGIVSDYNIVATAYNDAAEKAIIEYINGMPQKLDLIKDKDSLKDCTGEEIFASIEDILGKTNDALVDYYTVNQITNPSEEWMLERLKKVSCIKDIKAVSKDNDPNKLLGKKGGYTSCIYFSIKDLDTSKIKGKDVIEKGTDGGGSVEIYESKEYALNRCDYLSQFDGTVLYTGSYTGVGTVVIRTTYLLDNKKQVELTDDIIKALTQIEPN